MIKNRYYLLALLILILDHVTKWIVRAKLGSGSSIDIIPGYLCLSLVHNTGVAFGFFDKMEFAWKPYVLAAMALAAVAIILIYSAHMHGDRKLLQAALAITMGGILGNFVDRIFRGYVVDFIEFHIHESFYWPNFNVADSAITIGIALLLIDTVKNPSEEEKSGPLPQTTDLSLVNSMHVGRFQVSGFRFQVVCPKPVTSILYCLLLIWFGAGLACAADVAAVVEGMQRRYASVQTVTGNFQQTYRAPGIDQEEAGVFRLKKPGFLRWEYQRPEEKYFIADGRESFLYVPQDRQVTVQPLNPADLRKTPLELLFGTSDAYKKYAVAWEVDFKPQAAHTYLIRLTPRGPETGYSFLVLELDRGTYDLRRFITRESGGNTSEFLFTNLALNTPIRDKEFQFKIPRGVEVTRLTDNQ